jgi:hypothetical protein
MKVKITTDHLYLLTTFLSFLNMWIVNINDQSRFQLSFQQFTKKQIVNKKKGLVAGRKVPLQQIELSVTSCTIRG